MKTLLTLTIALFAITATAQEATPPKVTDLGWIAGCWEMAGQGRSTIERWGKASDNLMLGTSQTVRGTRSVSFEFLRIVSGAQGLAYVALPSNAKEPTTFPATRVSANEAVFENLKHDFPQRIIYKQPKADTLHARIEGTMNGKESSMDFPMVKVKCD